MRASGGGYLFRGGGGGVEVVDEQCRFPQGIGGRIPTEKIRVISLKTKLIIMKI